MARYSETFESVARRAAQSFPGIDPEDVAQEIRLKLLEQPKTMSRCNEEPALVAHIAGDIARTYCAKERYAFTFHSSEYVYMPGEVRALFENAYFEASTWEGMPVKEDYRLRIDGGGIVVALWDLKTAFEALRPSERAIIRRRYLDEEALAPAERKELQRAIDAATRFLNRRIAEVGTARADHDGPGARRPITNASAQRLTA